MSEDLFIGALLGGFAGLVWGIRIGHGQMTNNDVLTFILIGICVATCGWAPNCGEKAEVVCVCD